MNPIRNRGRIIKFTIFKNKFNFINNRKIGCGIFPSASYF
ncbi:MAG: hypothetical protein UY61_C0021G0012 [Candidatus Adlerbacteria bacterium GW2011_GWC1_50_9]|uniref:Uncharacterized protein n=1 Tax=Candidatus Adlerbacteria bacterium GW2011_GWC1_50_9 TaxID=1618608 RepID=A0A0G1WQJ3_9BACT|nr:MAG: hypothetical protein UY61_C0021G0012 [Candidatus Adlerbacteria bacterium GW2011_GWC1_50_9]